MTEETGKQAGKARVGRHVPPKRSYPRAPLETCVRVAEIIKEKNGGNPWPPTEVAKALGLSAKSSNLDLYTASGAQYGIIEGSRYAQAISITPLGRDVVYADSPERELAAKRSAFLLVEPFAKVLQHYGGNQLPEKQYLSNTLLDKFGIHSTIINELAEAEIVLADLTDHNPNVLFELGLRMAENKPVAIIKSDDTGRIFDVDNLLRVFEYDANLWPSTVAHDRPNLTQHIKGTWEARNAGRSYIDILRGR